MAWQQSGDGFLEADVLRWTEAIWPPNRRRKQKRPWGKQEVTAQITALEGDFVSLRVMKAEVKESQVGAELKPHKVGSVIRKKRQTLLRGSPERLQWSDESARAILTEKP